MGQLRGVVLGRAVGKSAVKECEGAMVEEKSCSSDVGTWVEVGESGEVWSDGGGC